MSDISHYLTDSESKTLMIISIANVALFFCNLCFALFNTFAHLCKLRITKPLIILFYFLTFLMYGFRISESMA